MFGFQPAYKPQNRCKYAEIGMAITCFHDHHANQKRSFQQSRLFVQWLVDGTKSRQGLREENFSTTSPKLNVCYQLRIKVETVVLIQVADRRLYTLLCRSLGRSVRPSVTFLNCSFRITAPAQPSATVVPRIRPCLFLRWY